jgi:hypothetical protein
MQELLGHSNLETTRTYLHVDGRSTTEESSGFAVRGSLWPLPPWLWWASWKLVVPHDRLETKLEGQAGSLSLRGGGDGGQDG